VDAPAVGRGQEVGGHGRREGFVVDRRCGGGGGVGGFPAHRGEGLEEGFGKGWEELEPAWANGFCMSIGFSWAKFDAPATVFLGFSFNNWVKPIAALFSFLYLKKNKNSKIYAE